jgi:hypothetical protein
MGGVFALPEGAWGFSPANKRPMEGMGFSPGPYACHAAVDSHGTGVSLAGRIRDVTSSLW